jgi:amino acid transporter
VSFRSLLSIDAIFPVLLLDYILQLGPYHINRGLRFVLLTTISTILGYVNWLGLQVVSRLTIVIGLVALSPFVVMCIIGAFQVDSSRWLELPSEEFAEAHSDSYKGFFRP